MNPTTEVRRHGAAHHIRTCWRPCPRLAAVALVAALAAVPATARADSARQESIGGAAALLEQVRDHRETMSADFSGFRSSLVVHKDGRRHAGTMLFRPPITLEIEMEDADLRKRVKGTVRSLLSHRMRSDRSGGSAGEAVAFADEDSHPLGRRVLLGDKYSSSYRIRDLNILEVDRRLDDSRLVITVMETQDTSKGTSLPAHFFVTSFDAESGAVRQAAVYSDVYQKIAGEYLPRSRRIVSTAEGRTETLLIEWEGVELLSAASAD